MTSTVLVAVSMAFALGTGLPALVFFAFIGCLLDWRSTFSNIGNLSGRSVYLRVYLILVSIFITLYITQSRVDLFPAGFSLSEFYFMKVLGASVLVVFLPLMLKSREESLLFLGGVALGAFMRGAVTVLFTICYLSPPYHGKIFDPRTWAEGNSPAFANMLILAIVFFTGLLANQRSLGLSEKYKLLSYYIVIAAAFLGAFLQARLFFIVVFIVCPILYIFYCFFSIGRKKIVVSSMLGMAFLVGFMAVYYSGLMQRGSEIGGLFSDLRFTLYKSFWQQVVVDPWRHAQLDLSIVQANGIVQFHNFFADVQRVSGTWAFLSSISLIVYIFYLILKLIKLGSVVGRFFLFVTIPCFLVLCTSVEPEGGGQVYLMMLAMGAIAANELDRKINA